MELSQVLQALRNADAAGDTEAATRLAQIAKQLSSERLMEPAAAPKKGGVFGAMQKGTESAISSGRTALESLFGTPEEAAKRGLERGEAMEQKYEDQVSLERVKKAYAERGLLPAAGEVLRQVPLALAEQAPNIAATLGSARAGAALGSLAGPVGTVVGGVTGAAFPSLLSQFGSNVERQAAEQQARGEPIDISRTAAGAAAVPQAALDVAGTFIPLGGRLVSKLTGIPAEALLGRSAAQVTKLADERLLATLGKGLAVGAAAEIPTEITQQILERAQAGLPLTTPDALKEYGETAYQVGLLAPIGAAGRVSERAGARQKVEERKAEEARVAAEKAELEKYTPEALRKLNEDYTAARDQMARLQAAVPAKPKKGATEEERAAFKQAKDAFDTFKRETFDPIKAEYEQRKPQIGQLLAQERQLEESRMLQMEQEAAPTQEAAVTPVPSAEPALDVQRLMLEQDNLRNELTGLQEQLKTAAAEGRTDDFRTLNEKRQQLERRIDARAALIEERGGVAVPEEAFQQQAAAKLTALDTRLQKLQTDFAKATEAQDYDKATQLGTELDAAKKERETLVADNARRMQALQEKQAGLEQRGQTRELFGQMPEQPEAQGIKYESVSGKPIEVTAQKPEEAVSVSTAPAAPTTAAQKKLADAQAALDALLKSPDVKDTAKVYAAIDARNQAQNEVDRETGKTKGLMQPAVVDIFDPSNVLQEAISRGDWDTATQIIRKRDELSRASLDKKAAERQRLAEVLDKRLDAEGVKRERANLFEKLYDADQQARFKNGTYADPRLQELYDKGGPQAVEYDYVMKQVEDLRKKVETPQGNAKKSWLQQLLDLEAEHQRLLDQMASGVAAPTMGEKVAGVQAKLGKGEAPAARQMDALERYNLQRKIDVIVRRFNMIADTKVKPVRDQITQAYAQLYQDVPLAKPSKIAAEKAAAAEAEGRAPKSKSRVAATAARIKRGDVRKEAETSEKMRELAKELGRESAAYKKFLRDSKRKLDALRERYGAEDDAVAAFKDEVRNRMEALALAEGQKTPEYKATLKEQIQIVREGLAETKFSKQEAPSKRTGAVTRKVAAAPRRLVTESPESRLLTKAEQAREDARLAKREETKSWRERQEQRDYTPFDDDAGTAYRMREQEGAEIDAKEAQAFIDDVKAKLPENVKFVYAATPGQIPVKLLKQMQLEGVDPTTQMVQGAVFADGTVLVVGNQHASLRDLEETVAHELVGHYGIDTLIGIKRLQAYANKTDLAALAEEIGGADLLKDVQRTAAAVAEQGQPESVQRLQVLREIIAHTEEARVSESFRQKAGRWLKELVGMVRQALRDMGFVELPKLNTSDVFYMLRSSRKAFESKKIGPYKAADGQIAFRSRKQPVEIAKSFVASETSVKDRLLGNFLGLAGRVQFVDDVAALSKAYKIGEEKGLISSVDAANAEFALRFGRNVSQYATAALTHGPLRRVPDPKGPKGSYIYESTPGAHMLQVAEALNKSGIENDTQAEAMLTAYVAGQRAESVGWNKLNFTNPDLAKKEYNDVLNYLQANPKADAAFKEAARIYKEFNDGQIDFLVQMGALSKEKAAELKSKPYIPYYRVDGDSLNLFVDKERPIRIGNVKDQPELKALVGDNQQIMPIFTSSVQNAFLLTRMGLRNQMIKEAAFRLSDMGIASKVGPGNGPSGNRGDVIRFMVKGQQHFAVIDQDQFGLPAELIVKGLEGIKTTLPAIVEVMGYPADVLRKFVTRAPVYAVRQMIRDPLNAWMTNATSGVPVLNSFKELATMVAGRNETERKLMATGAISSNVFTGDARDMDKLLRDITAGKSGWDKVMAKADAFAMQGDAATRAVIYKDSIAKGLTEQQALLRALEATNFQRRGLSPTMQALSIMIPFFNAQIQGLDVLYRAFKGDMPFNKQLEIRKKLWQRGVLLAAGTVAYAAMMGDDEAYKRAKPEERLANWFVYVPGVEEPVRVPIPFELGYLFKALPEALFNAAKSDRDASEAITGMQRLITQTIPLTLPQAIKPLTEVVLGKSFYSGDIESTREQQLLATDRYRDTTTELAKLIGSVTGEVGLSPIKIDYLIRGYTSGLGIALVQLANPILAAEAKAPEPTTKLSKQPFIGGFFQPVEGRGTLDFAYKRMEEINQTKATYDKLINDGKVERAKQFAAEYSDKLALASTSGEIYRRLGLLAKQERQVRAAPGLSSEQKDAILKRLDAAKDAIAESFLGIIEKTKPR